MVAGLMVLSGCEPKTQEPPKTKPSTVKSAEAPVKAEHKRARRTELPPADKVELPKPPEAKAIPRVSLSDEVQATNRVKVGDRLPGGELADLAGKPQAIDKLCGPKLTVLFFWTADNSYSITEMEDLQADVFQPLAAKGVQVVGVNLDSDAQKASKAAQQAGVKFPILLDPGKKYFNKLASEKHARTYLIDAAGQIRWFDVEYSRSTARDLLTGVEFLLGAADAKSAK
jgi:peroxiredoxin